jgi:hypothetical protein
MMVLTRRRQCGAAAPDRGIYATQDAVEPRDFSILRRSLRLAASSSDSYPGQS